MPFSHINYHFEELKKEIQSYVSTKIEIIQLSVIKSITKVTSRIIRMILLTLVFLFFMVIASIAGAIYLGNYLHDLALGFLIVAGFYFLLFIVILLLGRHIFRGAILRNVTLKIIKVNKLKL